jgi:hypothetical protein
MFPPGYTIRRALASRTTTPATVTNHLVRCSRSAIIPPYVVFRASLLGAVRTSTLATVFRKSQHSRSLLRGSGSGWAYNQQNYAIKGKHLYDWLLRSHTLKEAYGKFRATRNDPPSATRSKTEQLADFLSQKPLRFLLEKRPGAAEIFTTLKDLSNKWTPVW